jgi:predicted TIM-barrel fold metal-dependent hydrolase
VQQPPLVDAHFHVWRADLPLTASAWHTPPTDATIDACVATLDRHGVLFGVIAAASIHGLYNDYVREALKRHRRLRATATLSPRTTRYEMEQMAADGFVGIRFVNAVTDDVPDLHSADYRVLLRRVADLGWHVHTVDKPHRIADTIAAIEASGAPLVIDHLGHLDTPDGVNGDGFKAVLAAVERGRTWVKLSGGFRFDPPASAKPYAEALVRLTGGERLLWGSDWPFAGFEGRVSYADTLATIEDWVPDPAVRARICGTEPLKFYFA